MSKRDAWEMLELEQEECIRLERENAELLRRAERAETLNQITQEAAAFRYQTTAEGERDAALAVIRLAMSRVLNLRQSDAEAVSLAIDVSTILRQVLPECRDDDEPGSEPTA